MVARTRGGPTRSAVASPPPRSTKPKSRHKSPSSPGRRVLATGSTSSSAGLETSPRSPAPRNPSPKERALKQQKLDKLMAECQQGLNRLADMSEQKSDAIELRQMGQKVPTLFQDVPDRSPRRREGRPAKPTFPDLNFGSPRHPSLTKSPGKLATKPGTSKLPKLPPDISLLNKLTTQDPSALDTIKMPAKVKEQLIVHDFDSWLDVRETTNCGEDVIKALKSKISDGQVGKRRRTKFFDKDETEALKSGVEKFGLGQWERILRSYSFCSSRTAVDLKDKWRNMVKYAHVPAPKLQPTTGT